MKNRPMISLISLDFDGTILSYNHPDGELHEEIIQTLNAAGNAGTRWCANSGRDFPSQRDVIVRSVEAGLEHLPVACICSEALIYAWTGHAYMPLEPWNSRAHRQLIECHTRVQKHLGTQLDEIGKRYQPKITAVSNVTTSFLLNEQEGRVFDLFNELERSLKHFDDIDIIRNGGWVAVNHRDLGKGNALKAYARHIGVPLAEVLAIGDHHNDLTMLRGDTAAFVGCPGDAIPEVRQAVTKAGGIVGSLSGPLGTAEIIKSLVFGGAK